MFARIERASDALIVCIRVDGKSKHSRAHILPSRLFPSWSWHGWHVDRVVSLGRVDEHSPDAIR
jgi:hypothetical protein